jgi:hypothetical protein
VTDSDPIPSPGPAAPADSPSVPATEPAPTPPTPQVPQLPPSDPSLMGTEYKSLTPDEWTQRVDERKG